MSAQFTMHPRYLDGYRNGHTDAALSRRGLLGLTSECSLYAQGYGDGHSDQRNGVERFIPCQAVL